MSKRSGTGPYPGNLNQVGIEKFSGTNRVRSLTKGHGMPLAEANKIAKKYGYRLHATKGWRRV